MAGVTKVNPVLVADTFEQIGKVTTWFTVTFVNDPTLSTGPLGAIQAVYGQVQLGATIVAAGPVSATAQSFGIEGVFDAVALTRIETDIQALGTVDGIDLSGDSVTAKTLILA